MTEREPQQDWRWIEWRPAEIFAWVVIGAIIFLLLLGGTVYVATGIGKPWCVAWKWPVPINGLGAAGRSAPNPAAGIEKNQ